MNCLKGIVTSVSRSPVHSFSKDVVDEIRIVAGLGVEGDAHAGATVRHRFRVRQDPTAPNLCQVHLIAEELFEELRNQSLEVGPGQMGENITVRGIDLFALPVGARLNLGAQAILEITGLRDPCAQLNGLRPGLMRACITRNANGGVIRRAGVMAVALQTGAVRAGDPITLDLPPGEWRTMGPV